MPEWEDELRELLARLDVLYDRREQDVASNPTTLDTGEDFVDELDELDEGDGASTFDQATLDLEATAVRTDMAATLARLDQLARAGRIDRAVREDVMFVLRALMRSRPGRATQSLRDEWQFTSAAAVLHLSRAILRLISHIAPPLER